MKTSKRNKLLGLALTGSFSLFGATNALAAAGDPILNRATLSYDVGGANQEIIESGTGAGNSVPGVGLGSDTSFVEDRRINFTVAREAGPAQVAPNSTDQAVAFLVANTGNGAHGFLLAGVHNSGAINPFNAAENDIYTPTNFRTYVDADNSGFLEAGEMIPANAYIGSLAPGAGPVAGAVRVFVVADIPTDSRAPNPLVNDDVAVVSLVAQLAIDGSTGIAADAIVNDDNSNFSPGGTFTNGGAVVGSGLATAATTADTTGGMETVFNDTATADALTGPTIDATGANDDDQNAQQSAYSSYTIQTAALTVTKASATLWDPVNLNVSPKSIPTGYVQYTITIENGAGAADADLTTLSDALAASLALDPDFGDGTAANTATNAVGDGIQVTHVDNAVTNYCTGAADADGCDYTGGAGGTITVDINAVMGAADAQLSAGESLTITFNVIIQ